MCYNAHIVHPRRDASKPTRNGIVHLMHGLLLSLIAISNPIVCEDAIDLINRIRPTVQHRAEIIEMIKVNTEEECEWDAKAD